MKILNTMFTVSWLAAAALGTSVLAGAHSAKVGYTVGDKTFEAVVAMPQAAPKATVFIIHDWNGLDDYEIKRASMLADLGYRAVALDLFGTEAQLNGFEDYRRESGALYADRAEFRARIAAGIAASSEGAEREFLAGYCFGGAAVLESARAGMDLDGFISFHGGLGTPEGQDYSQTKGEVLLLHGSADPVSGMGDLASLLTQLTEANVAHSATVYGGARHSFTIEGSRDYDQNAEQKSWSAFIAFLDSASAS